MYRRKQPRKSRRMLAGRSFKLAALIVVLLVVMAVGFMITNTRPVGTGKLPLGFTLDTPDNTPPPSISNPLTGQSLYIDPETPAARQVAAWQTDRPADAAQMDRLAKQPTARWIGDVEDFDELKQYFAQVTAQKKTTTVVLYNIPGRDCGLYSSGGANSVDAYKKFVDGLAKAKGEARVIVIIEPDALAQLEESYPGGRACLSGEKKQQRNEMLGYAVKTLKAAPNTYTYLDAGNSAWEIDPAVMADRLRAAGSDMADGFSVNVSNFRTIQESTEYGKSISDNLEGKHFVIDTSRNGLGHFSNKERPEFGWCNPPGRALGHYPTVNTGEDRVDAYLYVKIPGESDGADPDPLKCFGGPPAGQWNPEYALGLINRWPAEFQPKP